MHTASRDGNMDSIVTTIASQRSHKMDSALAMIGDGSHNMRSEATVKEFTNEIEAGIVAQTTTEKSVAQHSRYQDGYTVESSLERSSRRD